jgi:DNA repair exonuclease SbcCD ATPase subunit
MGQAASRAGGAVSAGADRPVTGSGAGGSHDAAPGAGGSESSRPGPGDAVERLKRQAQEGLEKAQRQLEAAKDEVEKVKQGTQLPEAKDADEAAAQVRDLRERIDQDLAALEARLPPREALEGQLKTIGGAAAAAVAVLTAIGVWLRSRGQRKEREEEAERQARAIARHLPGILEEAAARREAAALAEARGDAGRGGIGRTLAVLTLLAGAGAAIYTQFRSRQDRLERWEPGPPPPFDELP